MKLVVILGLLVAPSVALAYPQYQLARDQTCSGCHISPAGGGLLTENGLSVAENGSTYGGAPEAAHGALVGPGWLELGADLRAGGGLIEALGAHPSAFPMQAEGAAFVHHAAFSFYATLGAQDGDTSAPIKFLQLREHFAMWQSDPGTSRGVYVRVGRFMPVYGLRFAEHNDVTRQYGQTPLYGETYGAALEYIDPGWEAHVTAFVHDPIQDAVEFGNGAAAYAEKRLGGVVSIGAEGRYAKSTDDARTAGGLTAKLWLDPVLLQVESQLVHQTFMAGGNRNQVVSYLMGSWFIHDGWLLDLGLSQFDADTHVKAIDIEAFDANLHWFVNSHWELLVTNRIQTIAFGSGGHSSGYSLFQFHYRL